MLVSSVEQSDSVVHIYIYIYTLFFSDYFTLYWYVIARYCIQLSGQYSWALWFTCLIYSRVHLLGFPGGSDSKESACNVGDLGLVPGLGRFPGGGPGNHPLQHLARRIPMDKGTWRLQSVGSQSVGHDWATKHSTVCMCESVSQFISSPLPHYPLRLFVDIQSEFYLNSLSYCIYPVWVWTVSPTEMEALTCFVPLALLGEKSDTT